MRRFADHLSLAVAEQVWPVLVEATSFHRMRARADHFAPDVSQQYWRHTQQCCHSGTGGRWRAFCHDAALSRYEARVADLGPVPVIDWAYHGSRGANCPPTTA